MLNATLFTSGSPVFLFVRDSQFLRVKAILSAAVVKVPRVPPARIRSFVHTPSSFFLLSRHPRRQSRRLRRQRGWRVVVDITRGLRGAVACPVSRRGIARDISSPLALPLAKESAQLPQMTIAATSRSPRRFNTKSTPPAILINPRRSPPYLPAT